MDGLALWLYRSHFQGMGGMKKIGLFAAIALAGCAAQLPVQGQSSDGYEHFSGTSVGTKEGGTVSLTSDRGRSCSGPFYYVNDRVGSGTLTCSDGQSGTFNFIASGTRGTGTGQVGGRMFTFTFG